MQMKNKLPPLNNLNTFSIAAKHLSFSKAAEELSITQEAVSQQCPKLMLKSSFLKLLSPIWALMWISISGCF
jgi:hypothetical protein